MILLKLSKVKKVNLGKCHSNTEFILSKEKVKKKSILYPRKLLGIGEIKKRLTLWTSPRVDAD